MRVPGFALILSVATFALAAPVHAEKRVALVIGNSAYQTVTALPNPVRDAAAIGELFRAARFDDVKVETDVGVAALRKALRAFADKAADADTAVVFYAGHGIEIGGRNYLIPVDAAIQTDLDVKDETVDLDRVLELIEPVRRLKLVILDACRDNPFASRIKVTSPSRSVGRGLASPEPHSSNTLVAYAARAGATAADAEGRNSPFTTALLRNLTSPGLDIRIALGQVHDEVLAATGNKQEPFIYGVLGGGILALAPGAPPAPAPSAAPAPQVAAVTPARPPVVASPCGGVVLASVSERRPGPLSAGEECALKARDAFKECDKCPPMVVIPAGRFTMGSPVGEQGRDIDEGPQHEVTIAKPFAVGKFEVTFDQWDACVSGGGCKGYRPRDEGGGRGKQPVINVSWDDAKAYASWLSRKTRKAYRLLSEAEWEYAARAGTVTPFWWGASISTQQANYSEGAKLRTPVPVDSFAPNPFGLYNVHGNVWEWVEDCRQVSYSGAPTDGSAWTAGDCRRRIERGGSWVSDPQYLRAACRSGIWPDVRVEFIGFRVARTLTP